MPGFDEVGEQLTQAQDRGKQLAAGREAFEFIAAVADYYAEHTDGWFPKWMSVISPACEGRDHLDRAPSTRGESAQDITLPDLEAVSEDDAARELASIAATLLKRLPEAAATARLPADSQACVRAMDAAAEIHGLLALDV